MDTIEIFDVASLYEGSSDAAWYAQNVTGDIPAPRTDFCVVTAAAPDNSSYNIYLYGGRDATTDYDDVYVLSLPSFRWIQIYSGQSPRWGHTCHLVANSQMLTVGGANGSTVASSLWNGCDWEMMSVAVYSLSTLTWGSVYDAAAPQYTVPNLIYQVVGGG
jgi:Kelch motif